MPPAIDPDSPERVAIIGMSGRFPGGKDLESFWRNLCDGVEAITFHTQEESLASGMEPLYLASPNLVRATPMLDDIEMFDAAFFGYTPKEAEIMDPQHRICLETAWEALEDAGYDSETYPGWIGVYAGVALNGYLFTHLMPNQHLLDPAMALQLTTANDRDYLPTRISYKLNLKGPSLNVQTACSTSLVAIHLACQALLNYETDMALAGGVSLRIPQQGGYVYQEGGMYSPDGHCRTFDVRAQGTVFGGGVGLVVLKRLSEAVADGDQIYAVIRGSAINNDGATKIGFTAPSQDGQTRAIAMAQSSAGVTPDTISYIEAHGTATPLGDPLEIAALTEVFRASTQQKQFCAIGSVKPNIGHASAAAGVAGVIKTVLALKHRLLPPNINFEQPNPKLNLSESPFYVNAKLTPWQVEQEPRRAGVSSFGVGGTNAHIVLEEAPPPLPTSPARPWQLLPISARTPAALDAATQRLARFLTDHPEADLADVAYTLQVGRRAFSHRRSVVCRDRDEALAALTADALRSAAQVQEHPARPVVFMFSGQGAQYVQMAAGLYQSEPIFRAEVDRCAELLTPELGLDLRTILYPQPDQIEAATEQLTQTALTQPALFVIEYALAKLWMAWGVEPAAMIGHSIGEYVAACLAEVFSLETALRLVAARGRLMQRMPAGTMLAVTLPEQELRSILQTEAAGQLSLAAVNGPSRCVVAGPEAAVAALERRLSGQGVDCRRLHTSHAFHSAMMEPMLAPFAEIVSRAALHAPTRRYLSNVSGDWISEAEATDPRYWVRHLRETVRFADGIAALLDSTRTAPPSVFLEVGPGQTLSALVRQHPGLSGGHLVLSSLRHPQKPQPDEQQLLLTLSQLWQAGVAVDWPQLYVGPSGVERRQRISLPTYPFERQRFWVELPSGDARKPKLGSLQKKPNIADWFYIPSWKRSVAPTLELTSAAQTWLVLSDERGLGAQLAARLDQLGQRVVVVRQGPSFDQVDQRTYTLNPRQADQYAALLTDLREAELLPSRIVHLWAIPSQRQNRTRQEQLDNAQDLGFYSLLFLAQALGAQNLSDAIHIGVVSSAMQRVTGGDQRWPEQALLLGPCKVIPQEYPQLSCLSIDLPPTESGRALDEELLDQLIADLTTPATDAAVAYRGYDRWVQTYEPVHLGEPIAAKTRLRERGVYLITGGLGGIGLTLAEHLASTVQARLVLTGRSAFPTHEDWPEWLATHAADDKISQTIRKLQACEALGAEVLVASADVADERQLRAVVERVAAQFGVINGVIHAAGVAGGGVIQLKQPAVAAQVLAPKFHGTWALDAVFAETPLDFLMLCSSTIAVIGGFGQVDYCAGNSFMDAFAAYYADKTGVRTFAINWDAWLEVGMAVNTALPRSLQEIQSPPRNEPPLHPLLTRALQETDEQQTYLTELSPAADWVLNEHRIAGTPALPGVTYLEMVREAFARATGDHAVTIQDVFFFRPLLVGLDQRAQVQTVLQRDNDHIKFRILSQSGDAWQEHARGALRAADPAQRRRRDINELIARRHLVERTISSGERTDEPTSVGKLVYWGPRWHNLKQIFVGEREGLARLELPAEFAADTERFGLHPALLDVATSFASALLAEDSYLPLSYQRITCYAPLGDTVYSYARYDEAASGSKETMTFDITLLDQHGNELVDIEGFTLKRVHVAPMLESVGATDGAALQPQAALAAAQTAAKRPLVEGMLPREGVEALLRILSRNRLPQIVVCTKDLFASIERAKATPQERLLAELDSAPSGQPMHARPNIQAEYLAPRNETEQRIAAIWQNVLGMEQVGVHDNFFELGGDSVLALQIVAKANSAGFPLTPPQLFERQTIAELAALIAPVVAPIDSAPVSGSVPLTPSQHWFFAHELPEWRSAVQAALVQASEALDLALLQQAFQQLVQRHDALRLRFVQTATGWQQIAVAEESRLLCIEIDLTTVASGEQAARRAAAIDELHARLSLADGPLVGAALLQYGALMPSQIVLVAHRLVIDDVSWTPLIEDLLLAYRQISQGQPAQLPAKSGSFKQWAEQLTQDALAGAFATEADFWLASAQAPSSTLPVDHATGRVDQPESSARTALVALSSEETRALLEDVPLAYQNEPIEVLLTALLAALSDWTGSSALLIDLEGDGRTVARHDLDLSRTVGWCATRFPLRLELPAEDDDAARLKAVKEQLRRVPQQGLGYGVLRYLGADPAVAAALAAQAQPELCFRYRGQPWPAGASQLTALPAEEPGRPSAQRRYLIEIDAGITAGQLQLRWTYSEQVYQRATIARLLDAWLAALQDVIEHCLSPDAGGYTPSDFPEAGLDQRGLDKFMARLGLAEELSDD
jgi:non-ribosomal peptide synthase protein (TIGR01720 family)